MRENRLYGSEGGGIELNRSSLPLYWHRDHGLQPNETRRRVGPSRWDLDARKEKSSGRARNPGLRQGSRSSPRLHPGLT